MDHAPHERATDRRLIQASAQGDAEAFREIVERHQAMVFRTCLRILRNEAQAEDAAQATFVLLFRKLKKFNQGAVLGGWLYRTSELVCREFIRSSFRRKSREQEAAAMNETVAHDHAQAWNSLWPELDLAMTALPQQYREVIVLRFLEGKSTHEAAAEMGISASAVATRLSRALEQLRIWFQRRGIVLGTAVLSGFLAENANAGSVPASLGPSILSATGAGVTTATASTTTTLMVKAALAKTSTVGWYCFESLLWIAWVDSMRSWICRGCPIPRWVHLLAVLLLAAGSATVVTLGVMGILTPWLAVGCLLVPPTAAYVGWLWMFGPEHALDSTEKLSERL